jgi:hypothetical protein
MPCLVASVAAACAPTLRAAPGSTENAGGIVVRAFWISDSLRATRMVQVLAYEGTPEQRGALLTNQRADTANWVALVGLPTGGAVLTVASIGFDRQLVPVTIRAGCPRYGDRLHAGLYVGVSHIIPRGDVAHRPMPVGCLTDVAADRRGVD